MFSQFVSCNSRSWLGLNNCDDVCSANGICTRPPNDCRTHNCRMAVEYRFDFGGVNVMPVTYDQILATAYEKEVCAVHSAKVVRVEPSFSIDSSGSLLRRSIVSL